jgi:arylsulfatase A-like enzyme
MQRLRGDEGATLADLGLLGADDFVLGIAGIVLCVAGVWAALRFLGRLSFVQRLARPRALLVTALIGGALSFAGTALHFDDGELAEQPVVALVTSFIEPEALSGLALTDAEWRALNRSKNVKAAPPAPVLPTDRPHNAIIFLAEGIDYGHTGFAPRFNGHPRPSDKQPLANPTPNLVRRQADHGVLFDRYYANWHASIQAIFSVACSQFPPLQGDIVRIKPRIDCGQLSEVARARGMTAGLFHGGLFSFYDKLALLGRRGFSTELDAAELGQKSKRKKHEWGIDDRAVVEATLKWIDSRAKDKPFFALIIPITAHYPYWTPPDFKKPFKSTTRELKFLNAVAFQDHVLEQLALGLEKRGLYDDTVIAWLGDHGHYVGEPKRATPGLRGFYEPNIHTPLVLLNPKLFKHANPRVSPRLGSHIDLMPTMLDALHLADDARHDGQSLLSTHFEPRRMFFGADNGKYVGFIDGHEKIAVEVRGKRAELYDLAKDPEELNNLAPARPTEVATLREDAVRFARAVQARIEAAPELSETLSVEQVYDLFMDHVVVSLRAKDGATTSCGTGRRAACGTAGALMRAYTGTLQRDKRRCVMVKVPPEGELVLDVKDPDTLSLLSLTVAALPNDAGADARIKVTVVTDGERNTPVVVTRVLPAPRLEHPRPRHDFQLVLEQRPVAKPAPADSGVPAEPEPEREICVQLSGLVAD